MTNWKPEPGKPDPARADRAMRDGMDCNYPNCGCCFDSKCADAPEPLSLKDAHSAALKAAILFDDLANVNETEFTGWGDGEVPAAATMMRVKSGQAVAALRDALMAEVEKREML